MSSDQQPRSDKSTEKSGDAQRRAYASAAGSESNQGDSLRVPMTEALSEIIMSELFTRYTSGALNNGMPVLANREKEEVRPWHPRSQERARGHYTLGLSASFLYVGNSGPEYRVSLRVASDARIGKLSTRVYNETIRWFSDLCADVIRMSDAAVDLLRAQNISSNEVNGAALSHALDVSTHKQPRLSNPKGAGSSDEPIRIGDPLRNAVAKSHPAGGCVTALVRKPGSDKLYALSAGHAVTDFGRAAGGTTVQRGQNENIGAYAHPVPFDFASETLVKCDAALVELHAGIKGKNRFKVGSKNHDLVGVCVAPARDVATSNLEVAVVGRNRRASGGQISGVRTRQTFLDEDDNAHFYDELVEIMAIPSKKDSKAVVGIAPGDSGGLVVRKTDISQSTGLGLGLVVGGIPGGGKHSLFYCVRLDSTLELLGVELVA